MDDETRRAALYKLSNMQVRVGRPSQWSDLSGLDLRSDDPTGNYAQTLQLNWERDRARLGGPLPDDYWFMPAHAADASFSPQMNAILFPAGLLQPPYFDAAADPAANFGAIGAIIGHEIGHGFDDQGSRFSGDGMIEDWWSGQSRAAFDRNAERLIAQYAEFEALPGVRLNSRQMVGENMADLTGVAVAYDAFQAYRRDHPEVPELLDGFTADQRFFMAWARSFRTVWSDEALEREARTSGHAPGQFRINGVVRNLDAWYDAFDVRPNDALYLAPDDRVRIW
jgi:endothelin-converting enzyme/putative endopeptidase